MAKRIIVNVIPEETRMALVEDGLLLEVAVERTESSYMVGNIYKGRVENVLPGMQAAFINIGIGKNAFLYAGDIFPHKSFQRLVAEDNLTVGAEIMIEIVKDAMGSKGPRATTHFSIPGRYVVVMPSVDYVGVSRRIESPEERSRLRSLAEKIRPKGMGVIVRTVAEGHSEEELARDFQYLSNLWGALTVKAKKAKAPLLLYRDADLAVRIIRDHVRDDIDEVIVDNADTHARMLELAKFISPDLVKKIQLHRGKTEIFTHYGVEEEWGQLADRRVELKCGGYLIIDKTEALTVIDVNTGRFIGHSNLADTVFRTNMEAAAEIARQLRLRDIGGIIVADFIDMQKESHKKAILLELEAKLKADNTKTNVLGLTELGLVEMTRKKSRQTYESTLYEPCPCCGGRGIVQSPETLNISIHRQLRRLAAKKPGTSLIVQLHPKVAEKFGDTSEVQALAGELGIELAVEPLLSLPTEVYSILENGKVVSRPEEARKIRKPSPRRLREEAVYDGEAQAEPLSPEEMEPLLAENFVMEVLAEPKPMPALEARLAAVVDSLWEPVYDPAEAEDGFAADGSEGEASPIAEKKPRRRRRSKKSVKLTAEEVAAVQEAIPDVPESAPAVEEPVAMAEEPKKKKSRRRRRKKKPTDKTGELISDAETATEAQPAEAPQPVADDVAAVKSKRRRRRKKKKPAASSETPAAEIAASEPELMPVAAAELSAEEAATAVKPKRRRRRKKPAVSVETPTSEATVSEPEPVPVTTLELPAEEAATAVKPKRRRTKQAVAAEDAAVIASDQPAAPKLDEVVSEADPAAGEQPKRRGRKKKLESVAAEPGTAAEKVPAPAPTQPRRTRKKASASEREDSAAANPAPNPPADRAEAEKTAPAKRRRGPTKKKPAPIPESD